MRNKKLTLIISLMAAAMAAVLVAGVLYYSSHRRSAVEPLESTPAPNAHAAGDSIKRNMVFSAKSSSKDHEEVPHSSSYAAGKIPAIPATIPPSALNKIKLPHGISFAQIPWTNDPSHPVSQIVALAGLPPGSWNGGAEKQALAMAYHTDSDPVPEYIMLAQLPWVDYGVTVLPIPPSRARGNPPSNFVMALCRDKQGNMWMATEGSGIYRYTPSAPKNKQWTQFTKQNTQGQLANNNIYALACDNKGRIWAGELNHGISVYNGSQWQNYDIVQNSKHKVLAGPLGNHVFALKFDPYTDQMWACTDAGISIYQCHRNAASARRINPPANIPHNLPPVTFAPGTWHYITQANGLPQNPDCITFGKNGTVYVGTQCAGIAVGTPIDQRTTINDQRTALPQITAGFADGEGTSANLPYSAPYKWQIVSGPWKMPLTPFGQGLPSNLLNAIAIARNGTVVAGTDGGIAFTTSSPDTSGINNPHIAVGSADGAIHDPAGAAPSAASHWTASYWAFERGQDFPAKVLGLWHPPQHWQAPSPETIESLPMEDYTTAVAISGDRLQGTGDAENVFVWIGHRQRGIDVWQYSKARKITKRWQIHEPQIGNYVTSLLPLPGGAMAVGTYGKGVSIITLPGSSDKWKHPRANAADAVVPEPHGAAPPTRRQLANLAAQLAETSKTASHKQPAVVALDDDWRTEGDWTGRYGRQFAELFAVCSPFSQSFSWDRKGWYSLVAAIGPHIRRSDFVRSWLESRTSKLERVLWDPIEGKRIGASLDDHGEVYPMTWQGPDLYIFTHVPPGVYRLSLYFFNDDGHAGRNSCRDYFVSIIPLAASYKFGTAPQPDTAPLAELRGAAQSRVVNFRGGIWKRFLVHGPMKLAIHVARNNSFNTILQGVFIDRLSGPCENHYIGYRHGTFPLPWMGTVPYCWLARRPLPLRGRTHDAVVAWTALRAVAGKGAVTAAWKPHQALIYRAAAAAGAPNWLLARWRWRIPLWTISDRLNFTRTMRAAYTSLVARMTVTPWK